MKKHELSINSSLINKCVDKLTTLLFGAYSARLLDRALQIYSSDIHDLLIGKARQIQLVNKDARLEDLLQEWMKNARSLVNQLHHPFLTNLSFEEAIQQLIYHWQDHQSINFKGFFPEFKEHVKRQLYNIIFEIINNAVRHTNSTEICIAIKKWKKGYVIIIQDNGKGFTLNEAKSGTGIQSIFLRTKAINGKLKLKSLFGKGTTYSIWIPTGNRF